MGSEQQSREGAIWGFLPVPWRGILLLLVLAAAAGVVANTLNPEGISLTTNPLVFRVKSGAIPLTLIEGEALLEKGSALFLDARSAEDFYSERIETALSLPADDFSHAFRENRDFIFPDDKLVIYDDGSMVAADAVAEKLIRLGFENCYVLLDGFSEWRRQGMSKETGS